METSLSTWGVIVAHLDGNWFDIASLLGGGIYAVARWRKSGSHRLISKETGLDIANGVGLFPLFMLALSILSSSVLNEVLRSNRLILSVAGVVALFAILED